MKRAIEIGAVGVGEGDDVALDDAQRPPHRVALAARRGRARRGARSPAAPSRRARARDLGGAVGARPASTTTTSSSSPARARRERRGDDRADRRRHLARRQHQRDRRALGLEQALERVVARRGELRRARQSAAARSWAEAARGAAVRARRGAHPDAAAAVDRDPGVIERLGERLVLERGARRQPAAGVVGLDGQRQRGAAEVVVLERRAAAARRAAPPCAAWPSARARRTASGASASASSGSSSMSPPIARAPARSERELRGQPVARRRRCRRRWWRSGRRARPSASRRSQAMSMPIWRARPTPTAPGSSRRGRRRGLLARQRARRAPRVASTQPSSTTSDLVVVGGHVALAAQAAQAALDPLRLVARGDDHHRAQRGLAGPAPWRPVRARVAHDGGGAPAATARGRARSPRRARG